MDQFEAFTSRFARMSDMLIQKVFRLLDKIELVDDGTIRDRINRAEKKGLIESADMFIQIRIVRNDIAHEYHIETLKDIYKKVLELTQYLLDCTEKISAYCKKRNYISGNVLPQEDIKDANKKYTILSLANDAGFNSKSSFNNIFRKITGLTPSEYRKGQI